MKKLLLAFLVFGVCVGAFGGEEGRKMRRKILITGCSRSGTWYITRVLQFSGLKVTHEKVFGDDGIVSWCCLADVLETPYGPGRKGVKFDHIFHQVRDPINAISSIYYKDHEPAIVFAEKFIPEINPSDSRLVKVVKFWVYWNKQAEELAEWTYRIEDMDHQLAIMSEKLGVNLDPLALIVINKETNDRGEYEKLTWKGLKKAIPSDLFQELQTLALHYGYSCED